MNANAGRLTGLLFALVAFWIAVYWWWPVREPGVTLEPIAEEAPQISRAADVTEPPIDPPIDRPIQPREVPSAPVTPPAAAPAARETQRPEPARPGPAVIPPQFSEHTVQRGETFASIARKYYGSSRLAGAIARANPFVDPERLRPGRVIRVPKDPDNIQGVPAEPSPPPGAPQTYSEYTVQRGDTLSAIAQRLYGDSTLASHIYQANRDTLRSEDDIRIGQVLKIPPKP